MAGCPLVPTYLCSFLQESDDDRGVAAPHRPVERAHPAVVNVLNHGSMVHQKLNLQEEAAAQQSALLLGEPCCWGGYHQQTLVLLRYLG